MRTHGDPWAPWNGPGLAARRRAAAAEDGGRPAGSRRPAAAAVVWRRWTGAGGGRSALQLNLVTYIIGTIFYKLKQLFRTMTYVLQ